MPRKRGDRGQLLGVRGGGKNCLQQEGAWGVGGQVLATCPGNERGSGCPHDGRHSSGLALARCGPRRVPTAGLQ